MKNCLATLVFLIAGIGVAGCARPEANKPAALSPYLAPVYFIATPPTTRRGLVTDDELNPPLWLMSDVTQRPPLEGVFASARVLDLNFKQARSGEIVDAIRMQANVNIVVHWHELEASGIDNDAKITLELHDVPLGVALSNLVSQFGSGATVRITYWMEQGVIHIGTAESEPVVVAVYEVSDVIISIKRNAAKLKPFFTKVVPTTQPGLFGPPNTMDELTEEDCADELASLIRHIIGNSWMYNGAPENIAIVGTRLVVTAKPREQLMVRGVLQLILSAESQLAAPKLH